ncbi:YD repeat-containing protein [Flavobacterium nitrogenifigens]|uniref:YD repeat-containing protein n=2 Tax=Flavobacterium TaxID=237 RepID=A0A7W7J1Z7_9FLAO|nr:MULTISPECIES: hypothetical protein [Flavobacterium]MBB4804565.1 YD repeat-containing protein [Flavobacterium nitrogenifigens]MBB6389524.1 YD repeat-containing protein [Flavobacterium notoginsengisoli]
MNDYFEKNCNTSNWLESSYFHNKLKNLKGSVKLIKQDAYGYNGETQLFEMENGSDNFSFEFNREKEIIRELGGQGVIETTYKDFKKHKKLSETNTYTNTVELFEYDEETDLANRYIKIKDGVRTEQELKISIHKDGSIIHSNLDFEVHYNTDGNIVHEKSRNSGLEFVYDYSGYGKKGYYTRTQRIGDQIGFVQKYGNSSRCLIELILYRDNVLSSRTMLFFDENGNLIQNMRFFDDGSYDNHYYFYNDRNLLIEDKISLPNGYYGTDHLFEYDQHDNLIKTTNTSYQYKYDQQGNWIERIETYRNDIYGKITREFTYFPSGLHVV